MRTHPITSQKNNLLENVPTINSENKQRWPQNSEVESAVLPHVAVARDWQLHRDAGQKAGQS